MPVIFGSGEHRYRVVENWAKLPHRWNLTDVASVAVDSKDRIYVVDSFNRRVQVFHYYALAQPAADRRQP